MRIECECTLGGHRPSKTISFPVTDEMCEHIKALFAARNADMARGEDNNDDSTGFVSDGSRSVKVYMSIVDADMKF